MFTCMCREGGENEKEVKYRKTICSYWTGFPSTGKVIPWLRYALRSTIPLLPPDRPTSCMVATVPSAKGREAWWWHSESPCIISSLGREGLKHLSSVTQKGCWLLIAVFEFSPAPCIRWFCLGNREQLELDSAFMAATVAVVGGPAPAGTHVAQMWI